MNVCKHRDEDNYTYMYYMTIHSLKYTTAITSMPTYRMQSRIACVLFLHTNMDSAHSTHVLYSLQLL